MADRSKMVEAHDTHVNLVCYVHKTCTITGAFTVYHLSVFMYVCICSVQEWVAVIATMLVDREIYSCDVKVYCYTQLYQGSILIQGLLCKLI